MMCMTGGHRWFVPGVFTRGTGWRWALYRFTARGYLRCRRRGFRIARISIRVSLMVFSSRVGGKCRQAIDLSAYRSDASHERNSRQVFLTGVCGLYHKVADRIVR